MSDTIGRITVPTVINSGQTFPLTTQYPFGFSVERPVIVHRFGSLDAKQEQRYYVGIGPRKFQFKRPNLGWTEANQLKAFWESMQGPWKAFTYTVPNPGGSTTGVLVTFEQTPISFEYLRNAVQVGLNLIEVVDPTQAPTYTITSTCLRFPSTALSTALLSEVQQIIPLVHIRVRESAVPDIYLSDRRVTVGGQLYLPRLIGIGEPGSDVLISQDIKGTSDNVRFTFGNGDRVMTQLANDTDLKYAEIDLCLFHVNSGILLQLWKGVIQNFTSDGTPIFPVTCSDGFFQIMNQYPERQLSRQCWKTYNDGVNCPWASKGRSATAVTAAGGDPTSCDYYLESANGCQVHGMAPYFGGHQADPQGVVIKDNSTGFLGFGRNTVTATSIISDTIWGLALPEIWCNSGGNPLYAFLANALMVAYRDESGLRRLARHSRRWAARRIHRVDGGHERGRLPLRGGADGRWLHLAGLQGRRQPERHEVPAGHGAARRHSATIRRIRPPTISRSAKGRRRSGSRTSTPRARRRARFASSNRPRSSRAPPTSTR